MFEPQRATVNRLENLITVIAAAAVVGCLLPASVAAQTPPGNPPAAAVDDLVNPDRPGLADGSAVIGHGRFQIESAFQQEFRRDNRNKEHTRFFPTLLRIGVTSRWEARIEGNTFTSVDAFDSGSESTQTSGLAPVSLGAKFHFQDSAGSRQPSLGVIVRLFPPSGTNAFRTDHPTGDLRIAADWDLTPQWSLNPNAGVGVYEDDGTKKFVAALFALTLNYFNANKTINPFVDMGLQAPESSAGPASLIVDAGIAYLPSRNVQVDASLGSGAHGRTPPHPFFAIGLSLRFHAAGQ